MQRQCKTISNNCIQQYRYIGREKPFDFDLQKDLLETFSSISDNRDGILELYNFLIFCFKLNDDPNLLFDELEIDFFRKVTANKATFSKFIKKYFDELNQLNSQLFLELRDYNDAEWGPNQSWCLTADSFAILFEETSEEDYFPEQSIYIKADFYEEFKNDCLDIYKELS